MATDALTPFLGLTKPTVNDPAGEDLWGQKLNANFDRLDLFASQQGALNEAPQNGNVYGRGTPYTWIEVPPKDDYDALVVNVEENTAAIDGLTTTVAGQVEEAPDDGQAYARKSKTWSVVSLVVTWGDIQGKPATFPPTLPIPSSGVTGLDAKQASQDAALAALTFTTLPGKPATYPPTLPIAITDVTNLQTSLNAKEPTITAGTTAQYWRGDKQWATFPPALGLVSVGDTPPVSPLDNQLYWKSNDGSFWIRFNDGTGPSQWVQVSAPSAPIPPSDDAEYVMVNGLWRLKGQSISLIGLVNYDVLVPAGARMLNVKSIAFAASAAATSVACRVSLDGTTFLSAANDYIFTGYYHYTGSSGFVNMPSAALGQMPMTFNMDNISVSHAFDAKLPVTRPSTAMNWYGMVNSQWWNSAANALYADTQHRVICTSTNAGSALAIKAFRFYISGGTFAAGSYLDVEWVY